MSKCYVGLKTVFLQALSEPELNVDLVYKFKKKLVKMVFHIILKKLLFVIKRHRCFAADGMLDC